MGILLGCIADDVTGGTDLCENLVLNGMRTVQILGLPDEALLDSIREEADALVISLKIRTVPAKEAVASSLAALAALREAGCRQFFWKYCSTFDSTPEGNIGPVADALRKELGENAAIVCPAFPENGRTVYQGHLFVHDVLLENSHMRHHPLTPMVESDLRHILGKQTPFPCGLLPLQAVRGGTEEMKRRWDSLVMAGAAHVIADAITSEDLHSLGRLCADHRLVTGGSGIARGLPANFRKKGVLGETEEHIPFEGEGTGIVLAGSCSAVTLEQIRTFQSASPGFAIDPLRLQDGGEHLEEAVAYAKQGLSRQEPVLIYSSAEPSRIEKVQAVLGREMAGRLVEEALAKIALEMAREGIRRFVIAGGETSGAVMSAFGIRALRIGKSIAPGVPWVSTLGKNPMFFALKSGNFGAPDFFFTALGMK